MSLFRQNNNVLSKTNNSTTPLNAGATYTGTSELNRGGDIIASCKTDQAGKLYFEFSNDNTNWDSFPPSGFDVAAGIHEFHNAVKAVRYFRVKFTNTSVSNQTYLRLYTYFGQYKQLNAPLNSSVSDDADSIITRSVLMGQTDGGDFQFVPVTPEGHLEVAIHDPLNPFGSVHTESLSPIFQTDAVYGINSGQIQPTVTSGSGTASGDNNLFTVSTGTTIYSQAVILGRKRLRYRAGQGVVGRFTALYTTPVANSYQIAGFGTAIEIISASVKYVYATAAFGTGKYFTLQASTGTYPMYQSANVLNRTSSRFSKFTDTTAIIFTTPTTDALNQLVDNDKITIKVDADSATGGGNAIIYITWKTHYVITYYCLVKYS